MREKADTSPGRTRQTELYLPGLAGHRPDVSADAHRLEAQARRVLSAEAYGYLAAGAGMEYTMAANRAAFERWRIVPRPLRGVSERSAATRVLGRTLPAPVLLAPIGVLELAHAEADRAVARAAAAEGLPILFSNQASVPMEACAAAMGDRPRWFQLYWSASDDLVQSFLRRAEACGCEALVVTLDTPYLGWRPRDLDLAHLPFLTGRGMAQYTSDPVFRAQLEARHAPPSGTGRPNPTLLRSIRGLFRRYPDPWWRKLRRGTPAAAVEHFLATYSRASLTWDDLPRLRDMTRLPIVLKGILHPDDARHALAQGMDGVIVSNHGGRQVDGAVAALDALPGVVDAVAGRVPVLFDSGIRGGADVFKALALGATATCLGRPYAYGLAVAGEDGVRAVLRNLQAEFDLTLGLAGCRTVADLRRDCLVPAPG